MKKIKIISMLVFTIIMVLSFFACSNPAGSDPQTWLVTVNGGTGGGNYERGETVTITASPAGGQTFINWTVNSGGVSLANSGSASTSFTMPANAVTVTANFSNEGDPNCEHDYGTGWQTLIAASCTAEGSQRRECTLCPRVEVEPTAINPSNHVNLGWIESPAGDTEVLTCTDCGAETISRPITLVLDSIAKIESYLAARTGTLEAPLTIKPVFNLGDMSSGSSNWQQLLTAIGTAGEYVNLDLSLSTMNGTAFDPVRTVTTGKDRIVSLTLPDAARSITGGYVVNNGGYNVYSGFDGSTNIKSISARNVTTIGDAALGSLTGLGNLTSVHFPAVTSIGEGAFAYCLSLTSASFPAVTTIGEYAFLSCGNLAALSLPALEHLGVNVLPDGSLVYLDIASVKTVQEITPDGGAFYGGHEFTTLIVAADVDWPSTSSVRFNAFVSYYNGVGNKAAGTYGFISSWNYGQTGTLPTPSTPTGLTADVLIQTGTVWLRWDASTNATGYRIERSTSEDSGFVVIGTTITNEFDDLDVEPSTTYYYRVIAVNAAFGNESTSYASANETTPAPPSPLTRDTALIGTWQGTELNTGVVYVFASDGTWTIIDATTGSTTVTMYTWGTRDSGIVLSYLGQESSPAEYTIAGNTLTISTFNGALLMGSFNKAE